MTPEQRTKYLKTIEKIENLDRPKKWRETKKLLFELKPWLKDLDDQHSAACKELRLKVENKNASSKSGDMRSSMKIFLPVYNAIIKLDPDLKIEMSGRNNGVQQLIGKQLWDAFPEYRTCRTY